jgi:glycosyltransferase involved in cell wall biosynthesis
MSAPRPVVAHVLNTMGRGGVPRVAYELLERLPERFERRLYCLSPRTDDPAEREAQTDRLAGRGVAVRFLGGPDKVAAVAELADLLVADRVDVVHTHSHKPNRYGRLAALRAGGLRVVAHYHNHYDDKWGSLAALRLERALVPATDRLVACSASVRDHLTVRLGVPPERVEVVPNGVEAGRYAGGDGRRLRAELAIPAGAPVTGTVGRLCAQKAPADFLHAAARVLARRPDAHFLVVGAADLPGVEAGLRGLAEALGLTGRVHFTGHRRDLADVYAAMDVFALSSHWEGFGLVLVEAMAAGVPVVATAVGPVPEVVGPDAAAVLVPPAAPDRLAEGIVRVLGEPVLAERLVRRGTARAGELDWDLPVRRLADLYDGLLGRPALAVGA